jgi:hypothetical protein
LFHLGFHKIRYKNSIRNSSQKNLSVNTLGATLVLALFEKNYRSEKIIGKTIDGRFYSCFYNKKGKSMRCGKRNG